MLVEEPADGQEQKVPEEEFLQAGTYVVAKYDEKNYVGKVIEVDNEDALPYHITFMEQKRQLFQWPSRKDALWCSKDSIKCAVAEPTPSGKSRRLFKLKTEDLTKMENL